MVSCSRVGILKGIVEETRRAMKIASRWENRESGESGRASRQGGGAKDRPSTTTTTTTLGLTSVVRNGAAANERSKQRVASSSLISAQ